jgi:F-type H+-transporting ATPase subunit b
MSFPLGFAENSIQLVPDGTLILHVLIILVMVYVLNATLFKPINQILVSREKRTRGRLSEAEAILKSVGEKLTDYERSLRQARSEAYARTEAQRTEAMKERQQKLNEMREQLAQSIAREKEAIQQQATEARATLEEESRQIAREIGSRVLGRPVEPPMIKLGDLM